MPFQHPHAIAAWRTIESIPDGIRQVVVIETKLSLDPRSDNYDCAAIDDLVAAAKAYTTKTANLDEFRIVSLGHD